MSWDTFAAKTRSQKVALAHIFPRQRWKQFTLSSGTLYTTTLVQLPYAVHTGLTALTYTTGTPTSGQWAFNSSTKTLSINVGTHPKTQDIILTYRMCFASAPVILPHDLGTGYDAEYEPRISDIGDIKLELDYENAGIALETASSVQLINSDGYFDSLFDTLIWENQRAVFYSFGPELAASEARVIFDGFIENKQYSKDAVTFSLKDQFKRLREKLQIPNFTDADGFIDDSVRDRPKRRIFGKAKNLRCVGVDKVLGGYALTGTFTGVVDPQALTGNLTFVDGSPTVTAASSQTGVIQVGDLIRPALTGLTPNLDWYEVLAINGPGTTITIARDAEDTFTGLTYRMNARIITGTGSALLDELSPEDKISFAIGDEEFDFKVQSVDSNTQFTISDELEVPFTAIALDVSPIVPWRKKNRDWHVAGHKLKTVTATVTAYISGTRLELSDTSEMAPGDTLSVGAEFVDIFRISGDLVVLNQALSAVPSIGSTVTVQAIAEAYYKDTRLIEGRDYTFTNVSECVLHVDELAEFNIARSFITSGGFVFTNGSRTVTTASSVDLSAILKTRDWIGPDSVNHVDMYEVLQVLPASIILRTPFTGDTMTRNLRRKSVDIVDDDALITVDCKGIEDASGAWVRTAADSVKYVLENDLAVTALNAPSFVSANSDAPQTVSYAVPASIGSEAPIARDVISDLNRAVFGALYQNRSFAFTFSVLQADKSETMSNLTEDEVLSYTAQAKPAIANLIKVNYRPFVDVYTGEDTFKAIEWDNDFVNKLSQVKNTIEVTAYLYDDADAQVYAERLAFLRSVTNATITVKGKLELQLLGLGDKVLLELDRLYSRYGNEDNKKVALVYGIQNDESNTVLLLNDFNGMFTRVPAIAPDVSAEYAGATGAEMAKYGYIVDDDTLTPDGVTNDSLGNNLIG